MSAPFLDVVLPVPLDQAFTYANPAGLAAGAGMRVLAPWGSRQLTGVVIGDRSEPPAGVKPEKIKPLGGLVDSTALLDGAMLQLVSWAAAYYQAPIGDVMRCALPPGRGVEPKRMRVYRLAQHPEGRLTSAQAALIEILTTVGGEAESGWLRRRCSASVLTALLRRNVIETELTAAPITPPAWTPRPRITALNPTQQRALDAINAIGAGESPRPLLLHGVTGSGKTAVYLAAIEAALERGESALMLVPEIGLTPALFADFEDAFPDLVAVLHSSLSEGERAQHWFRLRRGQARVAIGTRSAVFAPLERLGLILVDEEHDASFKQQESPRYHGRDLAVMRAQLAGARIVLGSATPSLESFTHARKGKYQLLEMAERVESRPLPPIRVIDMKAEFRRRAEALPRRPNRGAQGTLADATFSAELLDALRDRLAKRQQSMVLINRRGFAPVVLCRSCGNTVMCRDCALSLSFHKRAGRLVCHLCGYAIEVPSACPSCGGEHIYFLGAGSEKAEEELAALLPEARIARLDRDTARSRGHFDTVLGGFRAGKIDILIGTQMIAKGHDMPRVTLVGVLQADLGLSFPDFRAAERTFQLLTQVAGRAGRGVEPGEVVMQVQHPEHYAVIAAAAADFVGFYEKEANFRRWMHYPPYAALACAQFRHVSYDRALHYATQAGEFLQGHAADYPATRILGPSPALLARVKTEYRFQFLCKSTSRRELGALLRDLRRFARSNQVPATALVIDVDPLTL